MKSHARTRLALLAAVLALAALAGWALRSQQPAPSAPAAAASPADANSPAPDPTFPAGTALERLAPPVTAELPPPDAPLAQILPALASRADAGDRKAACRLSMELLRCSHLDDWASIAMPGQDDGDQVSEAGGNEHMDQIRLWQLERQVQCRDVPAPLRGRGGHYLIQAARAGEPEAMVRYAEGHHWPPSGRGIVADPDFDAWRREAPAMMRRALESGAPEAAFLLMGNYSTDFDLLSALVPDDPEQALAMGMLWARLFGTSEPPYLSRNLSAGALQRARERAEQMHQHYFQSRRFPRDRAMLNPTFFPPSSGSPVTFCASH